jgi:hypothetical protein
MVKLDQNYLEVSGQLHDSASLPPGEDRRLNGPHSRSGRRGKQKNLHPTSSAVVRQVRAGTPCRLKTKCGVRVPAKLCRKCDPPKYVHLEAP